MNQFQEQYVDTYLDMMGEKYGERYYDADAIAMIIEDQIPFCPAPDDILFIAKAALDSRGVSIEDFYINGQVAGVVTDGGVVIVCSYVDQTPPHRFKKVLNYIAQKRDLDGVVVFSRPNSDSRVAHVPNKILVSEVKCG